MTAAVVRIIVVDDQDLMRRGLHRLLDLEPGIEVVGEAADGFAALQLLATAEVDVALVDARMPGMTGVELITRITRDHPGVAALLLTTFDEDEFVFGSLRAGARGFLLKDASPETLVAAIRTAAGGGTVIDGQVAGRVIGRLGPAEPPGGARPAADPGFAAPLAPGDVRASGPALPSGQTAGPGGPVAGPGGRWIAEPLTGREDEVARLVATGASNQEIAGALFVTEGTVKNHVSAALRKLGLRDRTQLALAYARRASP